MQVLRLQVSTPPIKREYPVAKLIRDICISFSADSSATKGTGKSHTTRNKSNSHSPAMGGANLVLKPTRTVQGTEDQIQGREGSSHNAKESHFSPGISDPQPSSLVPEYIGRTFKLTAKNSGDTKEGKKANHKTMLPS